MEQTLEQQIKSLDLKQNAIKILINSFYGAFGNKYFYFHNNDIAQSITLQGQDLIKFSIKAINHYFKNLWHNDKELHEKLGISQYKVNPIPSEAAIYTDTDSVYSCLEYAIKSIEGLELTDSEALQMCLNIHFFRLAEYFERAFEKYAAHFHTKNRQNFELENLSRAGIWVAKKKYVVEVAAKGKKLLDEPYLMIKGLEAIQSSYPIWARSNLIKIYWILLKKGYDLDLENDLIPVYKQLREELESLPIDDIAFSFSVRVYDEYVNSLMPLSIEKGMPIYGRAAAYHNHIIAKTKNQKYPMIRSGSKIRFYYADDNEYGFDIFGYSPGLFPNFGIPINRDQQFFRLIVEPINKLLVAMNFSEISETLSRKVEIVKSRSRSKVVSDADFYPLYVVNSQTLEYCEIPEICQKYIGHAEIPIPNEVFPIYLSSITKYGLLTVIVPKSELQKYRERLAKKNGLEIDDPFEVSFEEMSSVLIENGWISIGIEDWVKAKAKNKESGSGIGTKAAYTKVMKTIKKKKEDVPELFESDQ